MKTHLTLLAASALVIAVLPAWAEKPLDDYSFIRGVNYGMYADQAVLERDLGYAKRVNLNSTRIFGMDFTRDVAVTCYWVTYQWLGRAGEGPTYSMRVTHTWVREGAKWPVIGGMSAPEPAKGSK